MQTLCIAVGVRATLCESALQDRCANFGCAIAHLDAAAADHYDATVGYLSMEDADAYRADLRRVRSFQRGMSVLDVGAGTRAVSKSLSSVPGLSRTALELSAAMLTKLMSELELSAIESILRVHRSLCRSNAFRGGAVWRHHRATGSRPRDEIANRHSSENHGTFGTLSCMNSRRLQAPENWESRHVEVEDRELVVQVLAGQAAEFRVLVDRHQQSIFRFASGLLGNREEARDVTQDAFLAAFTNLSGYDPSRAAFSTWLITIARNRCINLLKQKRTFPLNELDTIADDTSADPIVTQELSLQLDRALAALPVEQRSAFVLAEIEELPYAEIARIEQTSLGTVKSRIHRAKQRLQSLLEPSMRESE